MVTVWLQVERLVQASSASQVRVALNVFPQKPARFVTVLIIRTVGAASQLSAALGASKLHAVPHSMVLLPAQVSTGATVSRTVTVRLRVTVLEQASIAVQLWLMTQPQPLGAMPEMAVKVTLVPLHRSLAVTTGMAGTSPRHWWLSSPGTPSNTGAVVSTTVIVWLQTALLLHASIARQVRVAVKVPPHSALVTVPVMLTTTLVPPHKSLAVGRSKVHALPHSTVRAPPHKISGGVVSTSVIVWLHTALLLHASVARQVRVALRVLPQKPARLVVVLTMVSVTFVPHTSLAPGASKAQAAPHSRIRSPAQVSSGAVVSTTVMVWLHTALLLHASVARQVRVALNVLPQKPARLVVVLTTTMVTLVPSHGSVVPGIANTQVVPHSTTASFAQVSPGGVVSTTVTVWLHTALLLHESVARHVRVAFSVLPQRPVRLVVVLTMVIVTFVPSHRSWAPGRSKVHGVPHSTVLPAAQLSAGGVVSTTVTV